MRIGVFGGSFDPMHNAHLIVARLAAEQLHLDRVLFTVAATQPLKLGRHAATAEQRFSMVELALAGIPDFVADRRELLRGGSSFTVDTLRELAAEQPGAELILIMGADVAGGLASWREPDEVRRLGRIAVCHRGGLSVAGDMHSDYQITVPALEISSSAVRARALAGRSLAGWVPQPVADYIVASQLYVE